MSKPKVRLPLDLTLEEAEQLESLCKSLNITKIEFLRRAIKLAQDNPELLKIAE